MSIVFLGIQVHCICSQDNARKGKGNKRKGKGLRARDSTAAVLVLACIGASCVSPSRLYCGREATTGRIR